ncbi:selenocysteine-specific translation elongation factor [Spelaeicoccus albus]|uniref:Selenocysteine-specific elongation factor n=1 Tax=Spelaeicoccus albus TaxID=1280376 RepID=A0A7Z0IIP2_9MICO|nr:selenocysteine-specific translation elongation factor [Spelaeicoccus albus]NYI68718.1 selenocysteine-specific elongation factor [Spelaeicoccus albus]
MYVVATAGHVDHGKSTLVRALTGIEPDRWAEEHRRGLTIDVGFAWMQLPSGREVAFVDVPGHERYLSNALVGLGPVSAVCFVVAADEGWQAQSSDHRDVIAALGIEHGLIVITRTDRARERVDDVLAQAREELAATGLNGAPAVAVSALDGAGLDDLRATFDGVLAGMPTPAASGRIRLWIDRSFSVPGSGTVVTGTLAAGTLNLGDKLQVAGADPLRPVDVRGLQSRKTARRRVGPTERVAINLRGVSASEIHRGEVLVTPGAWPVVDSVDIRRSSGPALTAAPAQLLVHIGTASVACRLRPFDDDHGRLTLDRNLPLEFGDRLVLRPSSSRSVFGGARIVDVDPPPLLRRGAGRRRALTLATMRPEGDVATEVARRGIVQPRYLRRLGVLSDEAGPPDGVTVIGEWWVDSRALDGWVGRLRTEVANLVQRDKLADGLSHGAARRLLSVSDDSVLDAVIREAGLVMHDGNIRPPGQPGDLGPAEAAVVELEDRLAADPFTAPEMGELAELGLGRRELAAAERRGRLLRLSEHIVLLPNAPALAMRTLAGLDQPFTLSEGRQALHTTRRVAVPLFEHLDARGWTRRIDATRRTVVRGGGRP